MKLCEIHIYDYLITLFTYAVKKILTVKLYVQLFKLKEYSIV